jgi:hypothetical protein
LNLADPPSGEHDLVAGLVRRMGALDHGAGKIDAGHVRIALHQAALAGDDQAILVVDRGIFHRHADVARRQARLIDGLKGGADGAAIGIDYECFEHTRQWTTAEPGNSS